MKNIVDEAGEIIAKAKDDPPPPRGGGQPRSKTVLERYRRTCEAGSLLQGKFLIDIQLDAQATRRDWPSVWSRRITSMLPSSCI